MSDILAALEAHMDEVLPNECVGLLMQDGTTIKFFNQAQSPHRFFVNPLQMAERVSDSMSTPTALYHSHPQHPPKPSGEDERMMRYLLTVWSDVYHIILSPTGHRAYHVVNDEISERELPW